MWACRPYMHALPFSIVGAHFICARAAPPVRRRLARKRSCPAGGHKGRPYAVVLTWCVGRGAHTPPNQAAGTTMAPGRRGPAMAACGHAALRGSAGARRELRACSGGYIIRPYMYALPFPVVGAHCICARAAPPVRRRLARKRSCPAGGHKGRPYAVVLTWCVGRGATPRQTRPPGPPWPPIVAARPWRHVGMPPYEVRRGRGGNRGHLHARTALFHCRGALYMRPRRRLAGNCSRPDCTNGGLIQFIHSSFKECLLFCYRSFKIFQGFSGMIMPSGGHK